MRIKAFSLYDGQVFNVAQVITTQRPGGWWGVTTAAGVKSITTRIRELVKLHGKNSAGTSTFREGGLQFILHETDACNVCHVDVFVDYSTDGITKHRIDIEYWRGGLRVLPGGKKRP